MIHRMSLELQSKLCKLFTWLNWHPKMNKLKTWASLFKRRVDKCKQENANAFAVSVSCVLLQAKCELGENASSKWLLLQMNLKCEIWKHANSDKESTGREMSWEVRLILQVGPVQVPLDANLKNTCPAKREWQVYVCVWCVCVGQTLKKWNQIEDAVACVPLKELAFERLAVLQVGRMSAPHKWLINWIFFRGTKATSTREYKVRVNSYKQRQSETADWKVENLPVSQWSFHSCIHLPPDFTRHPDHNWIEKLLLQSLEMVCIDALSLSLSLCLFFSLSPCMGLESLCTLFKRCFTLLPVKLKMMDLEPNFLEEKNTSTKGGRWLWT